MATEHIFSTSFPKRKHPDTSSSSCDSVMRDAGSKKQRTPYTHTGEPSVAKKRMAPDDYDTNTKAACKRRRTSGKGRRLRLVLEPSATRVKRRRLSQYVCLKVGRRNMVSGSLNGCRFPVLLDSGASASFIHFSLAEELGLITGHECTKTKRLNLWLGRQEVEVISLVEVAITLGGRVEVRTPLTVLPRSLEQYYHNPKKVVLGVPVLWRGGAVQIFGEGGSRLYITRPKCLASKWRKRLARQAKKRSPSFWVRGLPGEARPMKVLVDTGAIEFYVTSHARAEIMARRAEHGKAKAPRRVTLDLVRGNGLAVDSLRVAAVQRYDFVIGTAILKQLNAVLDFRRHCLTFRADGKHFRVSLGVGCGGTEQHGTDCLALLLYICTCICIFLLFCVCIIL